MRDVAEALRKPGGELGTALCLVTHYFNACAVAKEGSKDGLPHYPAKVAAAMTNAIGLLSSLRDPSPNVADPYIVRFDLGQGLGKAPMQGIHNAGAYNIGEHDVDEYDDNSGAYSFHGLNG